MTLRSQVTMRAYISFLLAAVITVAMVLLTPESWNQTIMLTGMIFSGMVCHWKGMLDGWTFLAVIMFGPMTGLMILFVPLLIKVWPLKKDEDTPV